MGRTVSSFRIAAEIERNKWKEFRSYLDRKDKKEFDQMYDLYKSNSARLQQCMQTRRNTHRHYVYYFRTLQAIYKIDGSKKGERLCNI